MDPLSTPDITHFMDACSYDLLSVQ